MKQHEQLQQPFFAHFLESQKVSSDVQNNAGTSPIYDNEKTQKYPSDIDEPPPIQD